MDQGCVGTLAPGGWCRRTIGGMPHKVTEGKQLLCDTAGTDHDLHLLRNCSSGCLNMAMWLQLGCSHAAFPELWVHAHSSSPRYQEPCSPRPLRLPRHQLHAASARPNTLCRGPCKTPVTARQLQVRPPRTPRRAGWTSPPGTGPAGAGPGTLRQACGPAAAARPHG